MKIISSLKRIIVLNLIATFVQAFTVYNKSPNRSKSFILAASPPNIEKYSVSVEQAAELWTVSVGEKTAIREAGVPFMDVKKKDYFVDDLLDVAVSRSGGMGMVLEELAGGRNDGIGITILSQVSGNAEAAGLLPGDAIAAVKYKKDLSRNEVETVEETVVQTCECRDFDNTMDVLVNFPEDDVDTVYLDIKRIRRWPKIQVRVEYPPSQCAEGVSNIRNINLFAGENLKLALQNRGIILDDPAAPRCDYCGSNACYVSIFKGKQLLNPIGTTEEKLLRRNPNCRLSCKTVVGYNMQEGELGLRVNLSQWDT